MVDALWTCDYFVEGFNTDCGLNGQMPTTPPSTGKTTPLLNNNSIKANAPTPGSPYIGPLGEKTFAVFLPEHLGNFRRFLRRKSTTRVRTLRQNLLELLCTSLSHTFAHRRTAVSVRHVPEELHSSAFCSFLHNFTAFLCRKFTFNDTWKATTERLYRCQK